MYNTENGQPNQGAMKRAHSVPGKYASRVCANKIWFTVAIENHVVLAD